METRSTFGLFAVQMPVDTNKSYNYCNPLAACFI